MSEITIRVRDPRIFPAPADFESPARGENTRANARWKPAGFPNPEHWEFVLLPGEPVETLAYALAWVRLRRLRREPCRLVIPDTNSDKPFSVDPAAKLGEEQTVGRLQNLFLEDEDISREMKSALSEASKGGRFQTTDETLHLPNDETLDEWIGRGKRH